MARNIATGRWWKTAGVVLHKEVQHTVLYLGEINDSQKQQWAKFLQPTATTTHHATP